MREINKTGVRPLTIEERICILHDIYKVGEEDFFPDLLNDYKDENGEFSLEKLFKKGLTTKDLIAPSSYMNGMAQIQLGEYNYAKTFLISNFPTAMDTSFLSEITNIPCAMLTSVIFKSCPHKKAIRDVKAQNSAIKSEVVKANQKAIKNNYDPSLISEDLLTAREEAAELVREVTVHNQKLFFTTVTVTLLATSLDELKEYSEILKMRISDFSCQVNTLYGQQTVGFKTSLPLGMRSIEENGDAGLEEERRMFYVAFTRAKEEVEVSCIKSPGMFVGELFDMGKAKSIDRDKQFTFTEIEKYAG